MSTGKGDEFSALEEAEGLLQEAIRHQARGDSQWAEDALLRALDIYRREGFTIGEARALNNLGTVYFTLI